MKNIINILVVVMCIVVVYHFSQSDKDKETTSKPLPVRGKADFEKEERLEYKIDRLERELVREKNINRQFGQRLKEIQEDFVIQTDDKGVETVRFIAKERAEMAGEPVSEPLVKSLVGQGVSEDVAADLFERIGEKKMEILELRDQATREGWINTEEYQDQLAKLALSSKEIRDEFGDDVYDRYLYASGKANRILIEDIYPDSQAEDAELKPGDIIVRYAEEAIFSVRDLRVATTSGVRGETVVMDILRDGEAMRVVVLRGPLGAKIEPIVLEPGRLID